MLGALLAKAEDDPYPSNAVTLADAVQLPLPESEPQSEPTAVPKDSILIVAQIHVTYWPAHTPICR